jgi:hypothetical protein
MQTLQHTHFEHYLFFANHHESQCEFYTWRKSRRNQIYKWIFISMISIYNVSFVDNFSNSFRFNNVVFHFNNFQKFLSMRMLQHNSLMQKWFRQIIDVKFKRRCRFYYEFWRFRIENDHHCCMKYENSLYFFVCSSRVRKIFRRFSNFFLFDNVDFIKRELIFFEINTFKNAFFVSKRLFDKIDEWKKKIILSKRKIIFFV